jgi:phosphatidylethanolamine/phosphatidyl-N-methylethanolamine N-methyltransferase
VTLQTKDRDEQRGGDLDSTTVRQAYARWAPIYDLVFGAVFAAGRKRAIQAVNRRGGLVLELGVGTGIALPDYAPGVRLVGIDYSEDMLRRANSRVRAEKLTAVEGLGLMDGAQLAFADGTFDTVVAMFLITVVPDPEGVLAEARRVLKPGGEVVLVNHFAADGGVRKKVEDFMAPRTRQLGWRPDFKTSRILAVPGFERVEMSPVGFGGFTLLRLRRKG